MKADLGGTERPLQPAGLPWDWHLPPEPRRNSWHPPAADPCRPAPSYLNGAAGAGDAGSGATVPESSADCESTHLSPARMYSSPPCFPLC